VTIVQLDNTLRNVIRTNVTDIEMWNRDHTSQYRQGSDFSVLSPKMANNAIVCDLKVLQPYIVKRLHGGRIAAGEQVLLSYDFLPGKVDVEGHSTPNAFAEPECEPSCLLFLPACLACLPVCLPFCHSSLLSTYLHHCVCMSCALIVVARVDYSFMNTAIQKMASTFKGIRYVNFNHDEIRGSASIRSSVHLSICGMSGVFILFPVNSVLLHAALLAVFAASAVCLPVCVM
jgi:hypothetical protein